MTSVFDIVSPPGRPPGIPIPGKGGTRSSEDDKADKTRLEDGAGQIFPCFCSLWTIASEVTLLYRSPEKQKDIPLAFALSRYYRLLDLADSLPSLTIRNDSSPSYVLVFQ